MSPIKVSDLQESKLLEMCKELYPEYIRIDFRMRCADFVYNENLGFLNSNGWTEIHWFEFCCNILVNKLFDSSFDFGKIYYEILKSDNPIDYLYEQFKQLK